MIRFRSISIVLLVAALAVCARAQGTTGGLLYASDFANWSLPQGNTPMQGTVFYPSPDICRVTSNGYTFQAPKVGRPLTIVDGANTETFTPTAVVVNNNTCMISGTMAHPHSSYSIKSGTAGAQEAIDYQASQPQGANVVLTPAWTAAGGTTSIVTSTLKGNSGVSILDQRTAVITPYTWSGSAYTGQPVGSGTIGGSTSNGVFAIGSGASALTSSHLDDGVTTLGTITSTEPIAGISESLTAGLASATVLSSVNGHIAVTATPYNAPTDGVTDATTAFNSACAAAKLSSVPKVIDLQPGTYLVGTLTACTGVSFQGPQAGMGLAIGGYSATLKGKPGQDVIHWGDPSTTSGAAPNRSWTIQDVSIQVDDTVDPNDQVASDLNTTSGSATVTSATFGFTAPMVNKYVHIVYPGFTSLTDQVAQIVSVTNSTTAVLSATAIRTLTTAQIFLPLASPAYPHRWPGRWVQDAAMTSGSSILTSTHVLFTCGDVGQWLRVIGAGAAGADLVVKIPAQTPCINGLQAGAWSMSTIDLGVAASTTVTNAYLYVSAAGYSPYENIGACALGADNFDGNSANWIMTGNKGSNYPIMRNVNINSVTGTPQGSNKSCGIFWQSVWVPYGIDATQVNIYRTEFGIVEATVDTNPALGTAGNDFQTWRHMIFQAKTPIIIYDGVGRFEDIQLASTNGYNFLSVKSASELQSTGWDLNIPEFEQNYWQPTHLSGANFNIRNTNLGGIAYIDATTTQCDSCLVQGNNGTTLNVSGFQNDIELWGSLDNIVVNKAGPGNRVTGLIKNSSAAGNRPTNIGGSRNSEIAYDKRADFLRWNPLTPYNNAGDVWIWPQDLTIHAVSTPTIVADANSESGYYVALGVSGALIDSWRSLSVVPGILSHPYIGGANGVLAATKYLMVAKYKCPSIVSFALAVRIINSGGTTVTTLNAPTQTCSTTYRTVQNTFDLSPYAGDYISVSWGSGEIDEAWEGWRPYADDYNGSQPALLTGNTNTTFPNSAIPAPGGGTNTNLGGVQAKDCAALGQFVTKVNADGSETCGPSSGVITTVPAGLQFYGDGSEGALNLVSGNTNISGEHFYSSVNISAGATLTCIRSGPCVIRSPGACTVAGGIYASFNSGVSNSGGNGNAGNLGASGGGGGGAAANGAIGQAGFANSPAGGSAGSLTGPTAGGNGTDVTNGTGSNFGDVRKLILGGIGFSANISGGGIFACAGAGGNGGSSGGAGGLSGCFVALTCSSINFTGFADVSGTRGTDAAANSTGAGGGGAGGAFIMRSPSLTNTGTINVAGGPGAGCVNPAVKLTEPENTGQVNAVTTWAVAHVSTFAAGNPTVITVDNAGSAFNFTPNCTIVGTGGGANTGSGATCTVTMAGTGAAQTVASIAVSGGNGGYGIGTTYTTCANGGQGGSGWSYVFNQ